MGSIRKEPVFIFTYTTLPLFLLYYKTWVSCEENAIGQIWQVDPTGNRKSQKTSIGLISPGLFESFAYDVRNKTYPRFFVTKDHENGEIRRL
jgi:hypothetical protein